MLIAISWQFFSFVVHLKLTTDRIMKCFGYWIILLPSINSNVTAISLCYWKEIRLQSRVFWKMILINNDEWIIDFRVFYILYETEARFRLLVLEILHTVLSCFVCFFSFELMEELFWEIRYFTIQFRVARERRGFISENLTDLRFDWPTLGRFFFFFFVLF